MVFSIIVSGDVNLNSAYLHHQRQHSRPAILYYCSMLKKVNKEGERGNERRKKKRRRKKEEERKKKENNCGPAITTKLRGLTKACVENYALVPPLSPSTIRTHHSKSGSYQPFYTRSTHQPPSLGASVTNHEYYSTAPSSLMYIVLLTLLRVLILDSVQ